MLHALPSMIILRPSPSVARPTNLAGSVASDSCVDHVAPGRFYNKKLCADNVFEVDLDDAILGEVERLFYEGTPFKRVTDGLSEPYAELETTAGTFFAQRVSWDSNIAWVSVDERSSYDHLHDIFRRLRLPTTFASVVPHNHGLQLYSAFFVARTWCRSHNYHHDYKPPVGTDALTLITPLRDYKETDSFQLNYRAHDVSRERRWDARYVYKRGKAIVFGSQFEHSTEPGEGKEPHAYLCFTFGTDDQARWPEISRTLDTQSRVVCHPNGDFVLSHLGNEIERMVHGARE